MASSFPKLPEHLVPSKQLGKGAYGTVYLCDDTRSGEQCAVKHIKDAVRGGKSALRELVLLARLKHDNVMSLLDFPAVSSPSFNDVLLVLPFMHTDLHKVIRSGKELTERHVQAISCQILRGLSYLHGAGVAHRDLKPGNVLLTEDCKVKIADFGLARGDMPEEADDVSEPILTEYVVTRWYRAPEIMLLPQRYTPAVDIWSVGCIVCEMLRGKPLFPGKSHVDMLRLFGDVRGGPQAEDIEWLPKSEARDLLLRYCTRTKTSKLGQLMPRASDDGLDLCHDLLAWDPSERPCAPKAQEHAYLRRYLPKTAPPTPETFDWSFDNFKASTSRVSERLYAECARLHPEIIRRDHDELVQRGFFDRVKGPIRSGVTTPAARSRTPRASDRSSVTGEIRSRGSTAEPTGLQGEAASRLRVRPVMDSEPKYRSTSVRTVSKTSTTQQSEADELIAASMHTSCSRRNTSMPSKGPSQIVAPVAAPQFDKSPISQAAMWRRRPSRDELAQQPDGASSYRSSSTCAARAPVHDDAEASAPVLCTRKLCRHSDTTKSQPVLPVTAGRSSIPPRSPGPEARTTEAATTTPRSKATDEPRSKMQSSDLARLHGVSTPPASNRSSMPHLQPQRSTTPERRPTMASRTPGPQGGPAQPVRRYSMPACSEALAAAADAADGTRKRPKLQRASAEDYGLLLKVSGARQENTTPRSGRGTSTTPRSGDNARLSRFADEVNRNISRSD